MYGCESWTIKKAEHQSTVVLEKTPENPLDYKEIKPVNPIWEISPEYSLEGLKLKLKLKLQSFGHLMQTNDSLEKTLMLRKTEGRRRRGRQRKRWLDGITDSVDMSEQASGVGEEQGSRARCSLWCHKELDTTDNWTELNWTAVKAQNPNHEATRQFLGWTLLQFFEVFTSQNFEVITLN